MFQSRPKAQSFGTMGLSALGALSSAVQAGQISGLQQKVDDAAEAKDFALALGN